MLLYKPTQIKTPPVPRRCFSYPFTIFWARIRKWVQKKRTSVVRVRFFILTVGGLMRPFRLLLCEQLLSCLRLIPRAR